MTKLVKKAKGLYGQDSYPYNTVYVGDKDKVERLAAAERLLGALPHGSGIDAPWHVDMMEGGAILASSYHAMESETGFYWGWVDFTVTLSAHNGLWTVDAVRFDLDGPEDEVPFAYDLDDYLADTVSGALSHACLAHEPWARITIANYRKGLAIKDEYTGHVMSLPTRPLRPLWEFTTATPQDVVDLERNTLNRITVNVTDRELRENLSARWYKLLAAFRD